MVLEAERQRRSAQRTFRALNRFCAGALLLLSLGAVSQGQSPQAQDRGAPLVGRIIAAQGGNPIPYARVVVDSATGRQTARTDLQGRFALQAVAPQPRITVSKAGYAPVELTTGLSLAAIRLSRAAVIGGRVIDDVGEPVVGARVSVEQPPDGGNATSAVTTVQTDDRGEYRVGGLPARTFIVSLLTLAANGRTGKVYYPAAASPADASAIRVVAGEERTNVDFALPPESLVNRPLMLGNGTFIVGAPRPVLDTDRRGRGAVSGRVVESGGRPIANAYVQLFSDSNVSQLWTRRTASDGQFDFVDVPAGHYRLIGSKAGYSMAASVVPAGAFVAGTAGVGVDVRDEDRREGIELSLTRWGTIAGRVFDEYDDPVQRAKAQLFRVSYEAGRRGLVLVDVGAPLTDDHGAYRIHDVPPGQYIVSVTVGDVSTADLPGYVRTYFPATAIAAQAQFVSLRAGQELSGIDLTLSASRTARVSGRLLDAAGQGTTGGSLNLVPSVRSGATLGVSVGASVSADGVFEFRNVPPGQYVIQASRGRRNAATEGEFGAWPVLVGDGDVSGLTLQTSVGSTISGRVSFDALTRRPPTLPAAIELSPVVVDPDQAPRGVATATVGPDGAFTLAGVNGPRRLQVMRTPPGWGLKQILANGVDITDRPVSFGRPNQSLNGVDVVLTDSITTFTGVVTDNKGQSVAGASVVVFSADRDRWYPLSRFMKVALSGDDGRFVVEALPFGAYHAVAVNQLPAGEDAWQDPVYLESQIPASKSVTLVERQRVDSALRLQAR